MFKDNSNPSFDDLSYSEKTRVMEMVKKEASRRDVLRWLAATGMSIGASGAILGTATQAWANTPKRGGRLIFAGDAHGPADTLDPALFTVATDYFRGRMIYGSLTRLTSSLSYEPELAEEVLSNETATEWTFKLRRGIEFHDGKTMTADDVIYSMNRHLGEDSISKASPLVNMIQEWKKVNDYEVKAILKSPNADLPIALGTFHFKIIQDGTTDFRNPAGTGPYRVKEFRPGVRAVGSRFENYWTEGAYLDEIEHFGIGDSVARLNAFLSGDVDAMINLPPKSMEQVEATEGKEIWSVESSAYVNIACRMDMQPSGNKDLILAMKHLMDRERLVKGVLKGQGTLGNDQPIGPAYFDHYPDLPQRVLDPEKAKFHFDRSGIGSTPIPIVTADSAPGIVEQTLFLQREAAKIGLNIDVQKVSTDGYYSAVWLKAPMCTVSWNMRPTANLMLSLAFKSDAPWNETYHQDSEFDRILVEARGVTDPNKRKEMYATLQEKIHNDNGSIIPLHRNYIDAVGSHVKGLTYVPLNNFGGSEAAPFLWRNDV